MTAALLLTLMLGGADAPVVPVTLHAMTREQLLKERDRLDMKVPTFTGVVIRFAVAPVLAVVGAVVFSNGFPRTDYQTVGHLASLVGGTALIVMGAAALGMGFFSLGRVLLDRTRLEEERAVVDAELARRPTDS